MPVKDHIPHLDLKAACFKLAIRRSRIERYGVFAEETILRGKRVMQYTGERISNREVTRRTIKRFAEQKEGRVYIVRLDGRSMLDGAVGAAALNSSIIAAIRTCLCAKFVGESSCTVSEKSGRVKS